MESVHIGSIRAELTLVRVGKERGEEMEVGGRFPVISAWFGKSNLQKRSFAMTRRMFFLFVSLLAIAVFRPGVGFAQAGWETASQADQDVDKKEVVDVQAQIAKAMYARDRKALAPFFADDFTYTTERFEGRGEFFDKAQFLDLWTSSRKAAVLIKNVHHVDGLQVFGNTVVMTGHDVSVLQYKGKLSKSPRLFTEVYVKQHGRWQAVAWLTSDVNSMGSPVPSWDLNK
jgi:hypothetical protein